MWIEAGLANTLARTADIATLIALPVALVGLYLALSQLRRTQNALEAAERSKEDTQRDSALRQLLALLPSLAEIEHALDSAVSEESHRAAERELANWRQRGSEVQGMLADRSDLPPELASDLRKAIVQAGAAKIRLSDEDVDVPSATERARTDITKAVVGLTELSGRFKAYVGKEEEDQSE